ncbi:NAD-dependent epimerase/dehydratase family protein [Bacillus massiliglaciei]|uniref:NAD-dependent epimerase/dehydratase family protein n=1 Tax=Bacillus massiliglaciei TaxID=1816693 RepID=UPI000A670D4A|nr:NAD-dependent epimerase/dehydratase family protein [Bacillus massiliglaciei]
MKAFVTGGAGFIGSHLVEELLSQGIKVHIIDNLSTGKKENIHPDAVFHNMDVRDAELINVFLKEKPDIVFHLSAQVDVQRSIADPVYDAMVNIVGTVNVLRACRESGVKKIIYSSTSAVYGDLDTPKLMEHDINIPVSYYGLSKYTPEHYLRIFSSLYGLSYTVLRYANVYGPKQTAKGEGGVIAIFLDRMKKDLPLLIHGNGLQTRDFIYVKDIVSANISAMQLANNETINISTGHSISVNKLADILEDLHGKELDIFYGQARPGDIMHSCLDNEKAGKVLNWAPEYTVEEGLSATYQFVMKKS